jgi:hypothetical protein
VAVAALVLLLLLPTRSAHANGVPIRIPLTYVSGLSNWGPGDARGEAELSFAEATIKVDARGLPVLKSETYQLWLVKSGTNKAVSIATFNGAADGLTGYTGKLGKIDGYDYDLVVITVEAMPDMDPAPSDKRSLGGFFAPLKKQDSAPGITPDTQPAELPKTGEPLPAQAGNERHRMAMALFGIGGVSLYLSIRRGRRNHR